MEVPDISPLPEESDKHSAPDNELKTPSPSIRQSLADITKQFINWPRIEVDLKVEAKTDHESEYSLSKSSVDSKFPTNFEEDSSEKEQPKEPANSVPQDEYSLEKPSGLQNFQIISKKIHQKKNNQRNLRTVYPRTKVH
ncbi:hypothetical protein CEXT_784571 [Caerostris extrusa]|uniref:Uncharacterized protein n=1 Tax=Caerostris extrusa TaxID=172846 RepID=A0AAV4R5A8_CAEEX|nr:hypothetical protein CEXT_784571 [Caerostris extrusa]